MIADSSTQTIIVSIDCVHQPGSRTELRPRQDIDIKPLYIVKLSEVPWATVPLQFDYNVKKGAGGEEMDREDFRQMLNTLYSLESLRKRGGEE
jgi:hypothetical protein